MDQSRLLVIAMAEECKQIVAKCPDGNLDLPESIRKTHLKRMCDRIEKHSEDWPVTRLHRWIGYIQCGLIANRAIGLSEAKQMFDRARVAYPEADTDLLDHLDPSDFFEMDIGGLG